jgi:frataxin-like iron-binding protein CyaY
MNKLWKKFDELMDSLPDYIDEQVDKFTGGNSVVQTSSNGSSTTTIMQNGKKIVVKTTHKKTTITVNGKEYVEK